MKKKIYAVWFPQQEKDVLFFDTWSACEEHVRGRPNIRYRGFPGKKEAYEFLKLIPSDHGSNQTNEELTFFQDKNPEHTLIIYVDGSYQEGCPYAGWAWVALIQNSKQEDIVVAKDWGVSPEPAISRNIDGELIAVLQVIKWTEGYLRSQKRNWEKTQVVLLYDYNGIAEWAKGNWKAKTPLTQHYQKEMIKYRHRLTFRKVSSHTGKLWNEFVDNLAKKAISDFLIRN